MLTTGVWLLSVAPVAAADVLSGLPDPTRPQVGGPETQMTARSAAATGPELQSTMISSSFRRAIISGRTYKPGDRVDGAVLMDIQPYEVTLKRGNRETRLRLFPVLVKEPKVLPGKTTDKDG